MWADVVIGPYKCGVRNMLGIRWAAVGGGPYGVDCRLYVDPVGAAAHGGPHDNTRQCRNRFQAGGVNLLDYFVNSVK